jgi:cytoskeletal protein RodZ
MRLEKGIELAAIAAETNISQRYLLAIEKGDWDVLPSSLFAKSFARQYASCVGADIEEELAKVFPSAPPQELPPGFTVREEIPVAPVPEVVGAPPRAKTRMAAALLSLVAVLALCSFLYMGWQRLPASRDVAVLNERAAEAEAKVDAAPPSVAPAVAENRPEPVEAIETQTIPVPTSPDQEANMTIEVVASQKTWLSISANGKSVFRGILEPNQARSLEGVERARIIVGNAGGVDVRTNGKTIGPLGPPGQVRVVLLTPDGPQVLRQPREEHPEGRAVDPQSRS